MWWYPRNSALIKGLSMRWFHIIVIAVLAIAVLIFAFENLQSITVGFLGFSITAPLAVLFVIIYLLGMATGSSVWALIRWAWEGSRKGTVEKQRRL